MRKLALLGPCALLLILATEQQSSAWLNFKFGAGINWNWQSGGNNTLWGLFRNGQPPGYGNHCDPACQPCGGNNLWGGCGNGCCPPCGMMPQQCFPQGMMQQQPCGAYTSQPQGQCCPTHLPNYPSFGNGHFCPSEFQYFGNQPNTQQNYATELPQLNSLTQNGHAQNWQAAYGNPYSTATYSYPYWSGSYANYPNYHANQGGYSVSTSNYYNPASYNYPYQSTAGYYSYPYSSSSSYYPYSGWSNYCWPSYQNSGPYSYYCNYGRY